MPKSSSLTPDSLRRIIVEELLKNNGFLLAEIKKVDTKLDGVEARLEAKIADLAKTMNFRFDQVYDAIQEVMGVLDENTDKKIENLRSDMEPRIKKLEQNFTAA